MYIWQVFGGFLDIVGRGKCGSIVYYNVICDEVTGMCKLWQVELSKIINIFKYILIISEYYNTIWCGCIHHPGAYHWLQYDARI